MKYSGDSKLLCEFSKLSKLNAFNLLGYLFTKSVQNSFQYVRKVYYLDLNHVSIQRIRIRVQTYSHAHGLGFNRKHLELCLHTVYCVCMGN